MTFVDCQFSGSKMVISAAVQSLVLCLVSGKTEEGIENVYSVGPVNSLLLQDAVLCCRVLGSVFE